MNIDLVLISFYNLMLIKMCFFWDSMFCVMVRGENMIIGEVIKSKLWLVDLVGSERVVKSDV